MSRESFIKGTLILALAAFVARFLGMVVRAPLLYLLGNDGMASYVIANNIYMVLLVVATAGIPSALSKLISEKMTLDQPEEARKIFQAAVWFSLAAGFIITVGLYGLAPWYAVNVAENPQSALSIRALAPALLLFPLIAIMRGFFQGNQIMKAGGISQIVEQFARVGVALLLAYVMVRLGYDSEWTAAGASFGGVAGSIAALLVMMYFWRNYKRTRLQNVGKATTSYRDIYRMIFKLSIRISLISMAVPLVFAIDSSTVILLMKDQVGVEQATELLGLLGGKAQPLAGIPTILAIALSMSILPVISAAFTRKDMDEVGQKTSQALGLTLISGMPLIIALVVAARPVNGMLFPDLEGTGMIATLTLMSLFQVMMLTSGSILMGMGKTTAPMIHVALGVAVKLVASFLLAPYLGMYGIILATGLCFWLTMQLNLRSLRKDVTFEVLGRRWLSFAVTVIVATASGWGAEWLLHEYALFNPHKISYMWHAMVAGGITMAIYGVLLLKLKIVGQEELALFPGPVRKIAQRVSRILRVR